MYIPLHADDPLPTTNGHRRDWVEKVKNSTIGLLVGALGVTIGAVIRAKATIRIVAGDIILACGQAVISAIAVNLVDGNKLENILKTIQHQLNMSHDFGFVRVHEGFQFKEFLKHAQYGDVVCWIHTWVCGTEWRPTVLAKLQEGVRFRALFLNPNSDTAENLQNVLLTTSRGHGFKELMEDIAFEHGDRFQASTYDRLPAGMVLIRDSNGKPKRAFVTFVINKPISHSRPYAPWIEFAWVDGQDPYLKYLNDFFDAKSSPGVEV